MTMNTLLRNSLVVATGAWALWKLNRYLVGQRNSFSFRNRVVLITGGSRGLGLVLARQLADEGARLCLCARDSLELEAAATELRNQGAEVVTFACDLTESGKVPELVAFVNETLGAVEVLINNAGTIQVGPNEAMTSSDVDYALKLHLWAPLQLVDAVLPGKRSNAFGRIVNIASIGGELSVPHLLPYCISKFALVGYSRGIRYELAREGIFVTTICPGLMRTGSHRHARFKGQHRAEFTWFSISGSLPVLSMSAERAANQIIQACRQGQSHLTLGMPAKAAVILDALSPELMTEMMSLTAELLPHNGGIRERALEGSASTSTWSPSWLTTLSDQAAIQNNEMF
jgi:short-subunit dehydrogenase